MKLISVAKAKINIRNKRNEGTQGRNTHDKCVILGLLERDGNVKAQVIKDVSSKTLNSAIKKGVTIGSNVFTDEWKGYNDLKAMYGHFKIDHSSGEYVKGDVHTNGIENFWSLLKRGIVGQYHKVSKKHLHKYVDEFVFRYNNRTIKPELVFATIIQKGLGV